VLHSASAPNAKEVLLAREGTLPVPMQKDAQGVWSVTTEALEPDFYGYALEVDGVRLLDPSNHLMKPNLLNLIAQGKAQPMIVVMPLGYGAPEIVSQGFAAFRDASLRQRNFQKFREALLNEVVPQVEAGYRVSRDRKSRAVVGLSMGGAESLLTGLNALDRFAWIGAFSSGGVSEDFNADFPGLDAKANRQLRLLWIACGTDDRLIDINRKFRDWLKSKGIQHTDAGTPGAHTWMVWRRNLASFASLLFQR
jgi:enterochelin esterase family protein